MRIPYLGYNIDTAAPTGGKAGKGHNVTSSISVTSPKVETLNKLFRYNVKQTGHLTATIEKAKRWIDVHPLKVCPVCLRTLSSDNGVLPDHNTAFGGQTHCPGSNMH